MWVTKWVEITLKPNALNVLNACEIYNRLYDVQSFVHYYISKNNIDRGFFN